MHTYYVLMPNNKSIIFYVNAKNEREARRMVRNEYPGERLPKGTKFIRSDGQ